MFIYIISEEVFMHIRTALLRKIQRQADEARPILFRPEEGCIRQMREALGLTLAKLAELCGVATPTMAQAERREIEGNITLGTLRKTAEAMNCELTYMFVPKSDMNEFLNQKAYQKAQRILSSADLHMSLENQKVKGDIEERISRLQRKLIEEGKLW